MKEATIFTDGSSRGNPGPGGWAAVVVCESAVKEIGGVVRSTTNNRMEISAAIHGLKAAAKLGALSATVHTDSSYLINGITKWLAGWKRNGWKTKAKEDVLNKDLWLELSEAASGMTVSWRYVGGHIGIVGNERCDRIATAFADGMDVKLYDGPLAGYDLPNILDISQKAPIRSRSGGKPHSYVSSVGGVIEVHPTWAECEKRVKGAKGAKYKKAMSAAEEAYIIEEFEAL
ncbi:MAG: ribonuclease HI [Patescibacteria group bacterium]|nr:ribonuclease HI [Patescibacteria group bacterium]MDE1940944.1 ribonuclease HI [Patescibacteria group bacterium]MDE1966696.1 ribonuclease HI [Patescibacteria group bacterium]